MPRNLRPTPPGTTQITLSKQLYVKQSPIHGLGLYSRRPIMRGEEVYRILGRRVRRDYDANYSEGPNWIGLGWRVWLIPKRTNPLCFTNHACRPNAIISKRLSVVALCRISPEDEIVVDYSATEVDPFWQMQCSCECAKCRKQIRAFPYLPKSAQREYRRLLREPFLRAAQQVAELLSLHHETKTNSKSRTTSHGKLPRASSRPTPSELFSLSHRHRGSRFAPTLG